jgi:alpha-L-fucosidase
MLDRRKLLAAALAAPFASSPLRAQTLTDEQRSALKAANADPTLAPDLLLPDREMAWWRDAKFGVFIHWGLYAIPARGEWHMFNDKVSPEDYAKLAQQFNPRHYDPDAWAKLAKLGGARYMVMTARHHDGFAMWNSPASYRHFDAMHSAAHRDLIAPYVRAVRREGLRVGLYYSPLDWRFPAYFHPKEMPENAALLKRQTYAQVEELMRNYGHIDILWWDGGWLAHKGTDADAAWFWQPDKLNRMVRKYQPEIVINPRSGWQGDYDVAEGPGPISGPIRARPWEKTFSINEGAWGYTPEDHVMTADQVIRLISDAVVRNGNVLANLGPDRDGVIPPKQAETLKEVGQWLHRHNRAVYGTRPGPLQPVDGVYGATVTGDSVFIHIVGWPDDVLTLPPLPASVVGASNLSGDSVQWSADIHGVRLSVPANSRGAAVTVIELRLA